MSMKPPDTGVVANVRRKNSSVHGSADAIVVVCLDR